MAGEYVNGIYYKNGYDAFQNWFSNVANDGITDKEKQSLTTGLSQGKLTQDQFNSLMGITAAPQTTQVAPPSNVNLSAEQWNALTPQQQQNITAAVNVVNPQTAAETAGGTWNPEYKVIENLQGNENIDAFTSGAGTIVGNTSVAPNQYVRGIPGLWDTYTQDVQSKADELRTLAEQTGVPLITYQDGQPRVFATGNRALDEALYGEEIASKMIYDGDGGWIKLGGSGSTFGSLTKAITEVAIKQGLTSGLGSLGGLAGVGAATDAGITLNDALQFVTDVGSQYSDNSKDVEKIITDIISEAIGTNDKAPDISWQPPDVSSTPGDVQIQIPNYEPNPIEEGGGGSSASSSNDTGSTSSTDSTSSTASTDSTQDSGGTGQTPDTYVDESGWIQTIEDGVVKIYDPDGNLVWEGAVDAPPEEGDITVGAGEPATGGSDSNIDILDILASGVDLGGSSINIGDIINGDSGISDVATDSTSDTTGTADTIDTTDATGTSGTGDITVGSSSGSTGTTGTTDSTGTDGTTDGTDTTGTTGTGGGSGTGDGAGSGDGSGDGNGGSGVGTGMLAGALGMSKVDFEKFMSGISYEAPEVQQQVFQQINYLAQLIDQINRSKAA